MTRKDDPTDRQGGGERVGSQAGLLTLFLPLPFLVLTGMALQLGLLQGPVEFLRPLLFLEANLFFSSLPLLFLFPLKYRGGQNDVRSQERKCPCGTAARQGCLGVGWASGGSSGQSLTHEMAIVWPDQGCGKDQTG